MSRPIRVSRLPLRDLLNHIEHRCRELTDHLQMDMAPMFGELTQLSRPKRQRSHFPTVRTMTNATERMKRSVDYAATLCQPIDECIAAIEQRISSGV